MGLSREDFEHAEALVAEAKAANQDCEVWHMKSDELWLFVLIRIRQCSDDEDIRRLADIALKERDDLSGWYA